MKRIMKVSQLVSKKKVANILSEISTHATNISENSRWWLGEDLENPLSGWEDRLLSTSLAAGGSGITIDDFNSRSAANFNQTGYFASAAFAFTVEQPYTIIIVGKQTNLDEQSLVDSAHTAAVGVWFSWDNKFTMECSSTIQGGTTTTDPFIIRAVFNGASSELFVNGVSIVSGDTGDHNIEGFVIGSNRWLSPALDGLIATTLILPTATADNTDAIGIETKLTEYYSIS